MPALGIRFLGIPFTQRQLSFFTNDEDRRVFLSAGVAAGLSQHLVRETSPRGWLEDASMLVAHAARKTPVR